MFKDLIGVDIYIVILENDFYVKNKENDNFVDVLKVVYVNVYINKYFGGY